MTVVVDTSVLIDHLRGLAPATDFMAGLSKRPACSEITRIEVIQGLRSSERKDAEKLFALLEWVAIDKPIARRAGELGRKWRHNRPGIGAADLAIAATAESLDAQLATTNIKHFPMFPNLRTPY